MLNSRVLIRLFKSCKMPWREHKGIRLLLLLQPNKVLLLPLSLRCGSNLACCASLRNFVQVFSSSPSSSEPRRTGLHISLQHFVHLIFESEEAKANPTSSASSASSDTSSDTSAWAKAFSFMKPSGGSGNTTGDKKEHLQSDGFLSGIFN